MLFLQSERLASAKGTWMMVDASWIVETILANTNTDDVCMDLLFVFYATLWATKNALALQTLILQGK